MKLKKRTLLIVEDDELLNTMYKLQCEAAIKEIPGLEATVRQAFDYDQAREILKAEPVDFISLDIALSREEEGKTDQQRAEREAGGMTLLKQLQEANRPPLGVVVSGETLQSYAIDAYEAYGILAFYQKDRFDIDEYKQAVKASLWYLNAAELVDKPEIEAAADGWQQALAAAKVAGIKEKNFPESIGHKIQDKWTHAVTGLPLGHWTEEKLRNKVVGQKNWTLIRVTIDGFSQFVSQLASQEEAILTYTVDLLKQVCNQYPRQSCVVGHLGHSEFTSNPNFVVILDEMDKRRATEITEQLIEKFNQKTKLFAPAFEKGGPQKKLPLALRTKILSGDTNSFEDLHRLLDSLGSV
jgi:DNA-binding NarL/FixJ family response regulator/GGDEF domain-containing protein